MKRTIAWALALAALVALAGCGAGPGPAEVHVQVTDDGYVPAKVTFKQGQPAVLVMKRVSDSTCATEAIFVETGLKYDLPLDEDVRISIPTDRKGTFHYACGLARFSGEVVVK